MQIIWVDSEKEFWLVMTDARGIRHVVEKVPIAQAWKHELINLFVMPK